MPIYRVQAPDGRILRIEGPDNASESDLIEQAQRHVSQLAEKSNPATQGGNLSIGPFDTGISTSPTVDQALSGIGSGIMDVYQGLRERLGKATPQDVAAKRVADAPLKKTTAGAIGNFAGQALPALATLPFPGLNTVGGAALTGGVLGAMQPTAPGESVVANTALGAGGGALGQAGANLIGRMVAPVRGSLNPEEQRLAAVLGNNGVPLDIAQRTGSKPLKIVNAILDNLPITSGIEEAKRGAQNQAFTKAVMAKAGEKSDTASPEALSAAFDRLGKNFNDIYSRNVVKVDDSLVTDMIAALDKADNAAPIKSKVEKIMELGPDIPGAKYQDVRTQLRTLQKSTDPEVSKAARDLKYSLDSAAIRSISPEDAALLNQTRREYTNLKPISKAMKASSAVTGEIPPAQLRMAVASDPGYVKGAGDMNDLARAGARFLFNPVPNSGTAQRMFYQGLLTGGLGGGTYLGTQDPTRAVEAAGAGLLGPLALQKALSSGLLGSYISAGPQRKLVAEEMKRLLGPALVGSGSVAVRP